MKKRRSRSLIRSAKKEKMIEAMTGERRYRLREEGRLALEEAINSITKLEAEANKAETYKEQKALLRKGVEEAVAFMARFKDRTLAEETIYQKAKRILIETENDGMLEEMLDEREKAFDTVMHNEKEGECCLCGTHYNNYGHNARPVDNGRCCDDCQQTYVLPARKELASKGVDYQDRENVLVKASKDKSNQPLSKKYLRLCDEHYKKWQKKMPLLWRSIMNKRYLLPQYRQEDYYSQEACDYLLLDFLFAYTQGMHKKAFDEVLNTQYLSVVRAIDIDRPTLYMEKDFAPRLMKSPLPEEYDVSQLEWRWPSFRVYLPKGFLTIKRKGVDCSLMFLDIVKVDKEVTYNLPTPIIKEIKDLWGDYRVQPMKNAYNGMGVSGCLEFDCPEPGVAYAGTTPTDERTIREIFKARPTPLKSALESDALDNEFVQKMLALGLKTLYFLASFEIIPDPPESDIIRQPRMEGDRRIIGLHHAKFVEASIFKLTESGAKARGIEHHTGIVLEPHWRSAHPKRQPYGPKNSLRKLIWVKMYHVGRKDNEKSQEDS